MAEFTIAYTEESLAGIMAAIESFGDKITVGGKNRRRIKIDADEAVAEQLAAKAGIEVDPVNYASIDMGMGESMLRAMAERGNSLKAAYAAVCQANEDPVAPVDGQPAERYVIRTEDFMAINDSHRISAQLKDKGLRIHETRIPTLAAIFFDVVVGSESKLADITVPKSWTLGKLQPIAP